MRVLRYVLNDPETAIELGVHAEILSVACKPGEPQPSLWVRVPEWAGEVRRRLFRVVGTGHEVDETGVELKFVGTAIHPLMLGSSLVWHVFEVTESGR
jgi:hypothetical protein